MKRWLIISASVIIICLITGFGFDTTRVQVPEALRTSTSTPVLYPLNLDVLASEGIAPPYLGSRFIGFREALGFKESQGDYFATNEFGYLGKYQFGIETLELMGVYSVDQFLNDPQLQEEIFKINIARNKWLLRKDIERYVGKDYGGVLITESGILAAAHLAGAGNVKRYLRSFGEIDVVDGFGTSISKYIKRFGGYDVSMVPAIRNPRI